MADTDSIVAQATADLRSAEQVAMNANEQLRRANAEVSELRSFLHTLQRYASVAGTLRASNTAGEHVRNTVRVPLREGTMGRQLVDSCIDAIGAAGKPLPIGDLLEWVLSEGLTVGGTDQKSNLAGYLSRDPRLESLGRNVGWAVVEPASGEAAASTIEGGTDDRPALNAPYSEDPVGLPEQQVS